MKSDGKPAPSCATLPFPGMRKKGARKFYRSLLTIMTSPRRHSLYCI